MDISLSISKIYGFLPALQVKLSVIKIQLVLLAAIGGYGCQDRFCFALHCITELDWIFVGSGNAGISFLIIICFGCIKKLS